MTAAADSRGDDGGARLLIVNPFHEQLAYVPMGSFGLCDYLATRGLEARIFNAALYDHHEHVAALERAIAQCQPSHVGIVLHWKELLESALHLAFAVKARHPEITVVIGGLTAGYFAEPLLERYTQLDFVVAGDPEKPLEMLLRGEDPATIPNLHRREVGGEAAAPTTTWAISAGELDAICFGDVGYLLDAERYVARISREGFPSPLGFPLMLGRGCSHDCPYCGGSKRAFREHSARPALVLRSVDAVLGDLRRLRGKVERVYICNETSPQHIRRLFTAIADDEDLAGHFICSYGSFSLVDRELLALYARAFRTDARDPRPVIELSPETAIEADRASVRDRAVAFDDDALRSCLAVIREELGDAVQTHLFYSRYHATHDAPKLGTELEAIHRVHAWLYERGWERDIQPLYLDLSTDPGSAHWEALQQNAPRGDGLELLLGAIKQAKLPTQAPPTRDNLCLYLPPGVDADFAERYGALVVALRVLERNAPLYYYNVARALGFEAVRAQLAALVDDDPTRVLFTPRGTLALLDRLHRGLVAAHPERYARRPAFFDGLYTLCARALAMRVFGGAAAAAGAVLEAQPIAGKLPVYNQRPRLDEQRLCLTEFDYGSQALYRSIDQTLEHLVSQPTVYVLCADGVRHFDAERVLPLLRLLDGERTLVEVVRAVAAASDLSTTERALLRAFVLTRHYELTCAAPPPSRADDQRASAAQRPA